MRMLLSCGLLAAAALWASPAAAKPKLARCALSSNGEKSYRGPCRFLPEWGGSFSVEPVGQRAFFSGISNVSVWIDKSGVAEVSGLTASGVNSRWGEARRSRRDRACWEGQDFRVCVY